MLYEASEEWLSKSELLERIWGDPQIGFNKLGLGGLGFRVDKTDDEFDKDKIEITLFFEFDQLPTEEWLYKMLPELRVAIDSFPILKQVIKNHSCEEIRQEYPYGLYVDGW